VKKGDVLFRVDPTPYQLEVAALEAQLVFAQAASRELEESAKAVVARIEQARDAIAQAEAQTRRVTAKLGLARQRAEEVRELVKTGIGNRVELARTEAYIKELEGERVASRNAEAQARAAQAQAAAGEKQVEQKLGARVDGEYAQVAQSRAQVAHVRAQLEHAKWLLGETTARSPCDCTVASLELRPGAFVAGSPSSPVLTLVEAGGQVLAHYAENELHAVALGNEVELALKALPGRIIKGKVEAVVWEHEQGTRPAVRFDLAEQDKTLFLAAGAAGDAAIYTERMRALHIIRKVSLRVGSYLNYIILKLP
jgi:multidrug resistance efflux pump